MARASAEVRAPPYARVAAAFFPPAGLPAPVTCHNSLGETNRICNPHTVATSSIVNARIAEQGLLRAAFSGTNGSTAAKA